MFAVVLVLALPRVVYACAACGCGDPTLTLAGTEQPFAGRLRFSTSIMTSGTTEYGDASTDRRLALGMAWAPTSSVVLSASAPLVLRSLDTPRGEGHGIAPGDLDLRGRFVVLRDRPFASQHLVTLQVGARIPLAPTLTGPTGAPVQDELQTASPTVTPVIGLAWSFYATPYSLQVWALGAVPLRGSDGNTRPVDLRAAALSIVQIVPAFSIVVGPEAHLVSDTTASTGGGVLFATLGVMFATGDVTPYVLARLPIAQSFGDRHTEWPSFELGAAIDL
jgi:hypothetical protein